MKKMLREKVLLSISLAGLGERGWMGKLTDRILRLVRDEQKRKCGECAIFRHKYLDSVISDTREKISIIPKGRKVK
jgi:hypothetical protein